jgi:hypothetical protein
VALFELAADRGDAMAQYSLARMHRDGRGVARDTKRAAALYKLAADQGYAAAQGALGFLAATKHIASSSAAAASSAGDAPAVAGVARGGLSREDEHARADAMMARLIAGEEARAEAEAAKASKKAEKKEKKKKGRAATTATGGAGTSSSAPHLEPPEAESVREEKYEEPAAVEVAMAAPAPASEIFEPDEGVEANRDGAAVAEKRAAAAARAAAQAAWRADAAGRRAIEAAATQAAVATAAETATAVENEREEAERAEVERVEMERATALVVAESAGRGGQRGRGGGSGRGGRGPVAVNPPPSARAPPTAPALAAASMAAGRHLTLADVGNINGRVHDEAPESTIGGQTTCIVCMVGPKSHLAVPCGHQLACERCTAKMKICPYCREPVQFWLMARVV